MIKGLRNEISEIDRELAELLCKRLQLAERIQKAKAEQAKPVEDLAREAEVIAIVKSVTPEKFHQALTVIYATIFSVAKQGTRN